MRGVELDTVIHISIQFWKEPWPYGMDNEKSEIRSLSKPKRGTLFICSIFRRNTTDIMLHLIQPRFKNIFGEHYYRFIRLQKVSTDLE